ncbi:MAG: chemotaxis protein CheW [Desulfobacteraceae bacterium]|nr:chemotaxis protein CheW [Desulfobacteraceae bacterium]
MKDLVILKEENCWKRIGVWGREIPRCPELKRVIHCRNCEVFTQAGRNLLERDLPEKYKEEWTQVLVAKKEEEFPGTLSAVIFRIQGEWLALPSRVFAEIIDPGLVHTVPHRKTHALLGVINVHGEIQLCVSLQRLLGLESEESFEDENRKRYERMMVVNKDGEKWVFPVDEIHGIHHVRPERFQNVPVTVAKAKSTFTRGIFGWDDKYVAFLDDELLLYTLARSIQ